MSHYLLRNKVALVTGASRRIDLGAAIARGLAESGANIFLTFFRPDIQASDGDELDVKLHEIVNKTTGKSFRVDPLPAARQAVIGAGGLVAYTRRRLLKNKPAK